MGEGGNFISPRNGGGEGVGWKVWEYIDLSSVCMIYMCGIHVYKKGG